MSSPIAFSLTWAQLEALRSLPVPPPARIRPGTPIAILVDKGFAEVGGGGSTFVRATRRGEALRTLLAGLARSQGHPEP